MGIPKEKEKYSYKDYMSWPENERWELINGEVYSMSPAPNRIHQKISGNLFYQIYDYLYGKSCEVYEAPFDVKLTPDEEDQSPTILQPDIIVCCDNNKFTDQGLTGAPDLIIEIVSPSTGMIDRKLKYDLYEKYGVKEYWIVEPVEKVIEIFSRNEKGLFDKREVYGEKDIVKVNTLPGLEIDLQRVFGERTGR